MFLSVVRNNAHFRFDATTTTGLNDVMGVVCVYYCRGTYNWIEPRDLLVSWKWIGQHYARVIDVEYANLSAICFTLSAICVASS